MGVNDRNERWWTQVNLIDADDKVIDSFDSPVVPRVGEAVLGDDGEWWEVLAVDWNRGDPDAYRKGPFAWLTVEKGEPR